MGGKILVTKTFGVSQLIYSMQACKFREIDIKKTEAYLFTFLWNKKMGGNKAPERIKRCIMKTDYKDGGLRVTDLAGLDAALKLRQFFRASTSKHPMNFIQKWITESLEYDNVVNQEYSKLTRLENIVNSAQCSLNMLTDKLRARVNENISSQSEVSPNEVNLIAATDILEYLKRKRLLLVVSFYKKLFRLGIENFKQLVAESLYPRDETCNRLAKITLSAFPKGWTELIANNITCDADIDIKNNIILGPKGPVIMERCTVAIIKKLLLPENTITQYPYEVKLGINPHEGIIPFLTARIVNHSTNMRIFKFRLLHMDIFTKERMLRFKMVNSSDCDFCGEKEDVKHVLWECNRARRVWNTLAQILLNMSIRIDIRFENLFVGFNPTNRVIEGIITRLTQVLLRIDRNNAIESNIIKHEIVNLAKKYIKVKAYGAVDQDTWQGFVRELS